VDDTLSFEVEGNMLFYKPYTCSFPTKQTCLLLLWDELSIPHTDEKQEFRPILSIHIFAVRGRQRTLKEFQWVAGHVNWALNVFPLLKPGLSTVYAKTAGKNHDLATIKVSAAVMFKLDWVARRVKSLPVRNGVLCAQTQVGFQACLPTKASEEHIFFFEALAVCSAFHLFADMAG